MSGSSSPLPKIVIDGEEVNLTLPIEPTAGLSADELLNKVEEAHTSSVKAMDAFINAGSAVTARAGEYFIALKDKVKVEMEQLVTASRQLKQRNE